MDLETLSYTLLDKLSYLSQSKRQHHQWCLCRVHLGLNNLRGIKNHHFLPEKQRRT